MAYQPLSGQRLAPGPAWVDYSTIRTFPALEQKSSWFEQNIMDPIRSFGSGSNSLLSGAGWLAEQLGAEDFGQAIQEFAQHGVDYWQSSLTPETQEALKKDLFEVTDQGIDFNFTKLVNGVAGSAPSFVVGLGAGGALAKGLQMFANPLGRSVLVNQINAAKMAGQGTEAWKVGEAAAKSLQWVDNLIGIGGYGAGEGVMAGAAVGAEVSNTIKGMDHASLIERSERYRMLYDSYSGEPEERRQALAKGALADEASTDAGWQSGLATAVLGAPAGAFYGRLLGPSSTRLWQEAEKFKLLRGSRTGAALEGFVTEAGTEALQSASEQMFTNIGIQQADETQDTWEGVGEAAIEGGLIGGVLGGGVGALAGNEYTAKAQADREKEQQMRETDRVVQQSLEAIEQHGLSDYAARILEAQPERGRLATLSDLSYMAEYGEVREETIEELFPDIDDEIQHFNPSDMLEGVRPVMAADNKRVESRTEYSAGLPQKGEDEDAKEYAYRMIDMVGQPTDLPQEFGRYFEMKKADLIVPLSSITPAKANRSSNNSARLMALAGEGVLPARAPIDVRMEADGRFTILDGNGTHAAAKTFGWTEMPVRIREIAPEMEKAGFGLHQFERGFLPKAQSVKLTAIYNRAKAVLPQAQSDFQQVADAVGGTLEMGDLKGRFRAEEKTATDYGNDPTRLRDLVRGTIVVDSIAQANDIASKLGGRVLESKDTLDASKAAYPGGYRDRKLIVDVDGVASELQINLRPMVEAKEKAHKLYDKVRTLEGDAVREGRKLTPEETAKRDAYIKQQEAIYLPAWDKILSQEAAGSGYKVDALSSSEGGSSLGLTPGPSNATRAPPVASEMDATGIPSYQNNRAPSGSSAADDTPPASTSSTDFRTTQPSSSDSTILPQGGARFSLRAAARSAATSPTNDIAEPTEAQKSAGNYVKGHRRVKGLDLTFENPAGSTRKLSKREGSIELKDHYGYIRGFQGADGDHLDVYVKDTDDDTIDSAPIYAVEQLTPDGKFDEHKVYMGYGSEKDVRSSFLAHQQLKPAMRMGPKIRKFDNAAEFKQWAREQEQQHQARAVGFEFATSKDGRLQVRGDLALARQRMKDVGVPTKGTIKRDERGEYLDVTPAAANAVKAAITGREIKASRAGAVLAHSTKADGTLLGAPAKYNTERKMKPLRELLKKLALEGEPGRFWYEQSSQDIMDFVGGDKEEADLFAKLLAIYSPQMKVGANTTVALKAYYQLKNGLPVKAKTETQDRKAQAAFDGAPLREWMGEKTNNFYVNLMLRIDPVKVADLQGATIDMWMMRAFEYDTDAPTATQYHFAEIETNRLARELGWEPQQVQAAIWVAMKARTENDGVKKATEAQSEAAGDMVNVETIDEETGKKKKVRTFKDDAASSRHRRRWLDNALAHNPTKEDTAGAAFHFGDGLRAHASQLAWEATPSTNVKEWSWIHGNMDAKLELQARIQDAIGSSILRELGLLTEGAVFGFGGWQGAVSPSSQEVVVASPVTVPVPGLKTLKRAVMPEIAKRMDAAAAAYGLLLKQDGVAWHRPFYAENIRDSNGVHLEVGAALTAEQTQMLYDAVVAEARKIGAESPQNIAPIPTETGVRFLNFNSVVLMDKTGKPVRVKYNKKTGEPILDDKRKYIPDENGITVNDNESFHKVIEKAYASVESLPEAEHLVFRSDGNMVMDTDEGYKDGQGYRKRIADAGFGDQLGRLESALVQKIDAVYADVAAKYGPKQGKQGTRFRLREGSAGSDRDALGGNGAQAQAGERVAPPKFSSRKVHPKAVSAIGIHYGPAGLKALDPTMAGTGAAGGERRRFGPGRFGKTNPRLNFYVREPGAGVPPSERVVGGAESYQVELMNLYDYDADPLGLVDANRINADALEEEVTDAGFDGILFPTHPNIPVRTAIVFGFKRKIPAVPVPAGEPVLDLRYSLKAKDTIDVDGTERPTTDSTGKRIHPTDDGIRNFWRWFGDSKVVDEHGRPIPQFHATKADFEEFRIRRSDIGAHFGTVAQAQDRRPDSFMLPVYLRIERPLRVKDQGRWNVPQLKRMLGQLSEEHGWQKTEWQNLITVPQIRGYLEDKGFDGLVYLNEWEAPRRRRPEDEAASKRADEDYERARQAVIDAGYRDPKAYPGDAQGTSVLDAYKKAMEARADAFAFVFSNAEDVRADSYAIFHPKQVKSATGNTGAFSPTDKRITYSISEPPPSGLSAKAVQGLVNTLNWAKDKIRVFETEADLPTHLRDLIPTSYQGRVQGFYDPASKSVVIVSRNIDSPDEAYRTIVEEHLRHEGLRRFFTPAKMDQFLDGIYTALPQDAIRSLAGTYSLDLATTDGRRVAAEEYIAKMKLSQERSPLMARIGDWFRGQLRSMGFKVKYTNRDIIHILQQIEDGVRSGRLASPAWDGVGQDPVAPMYSLTGVAPVAPDFKAWFGKSKMTISGRAGGEPATLYHGTTKEFSGFSKDKIAAGEHGFFFTFSENDARYYAERFDDGGTPRVISANIKIEKPLTMSKVRGAKRIVESDFDNDLTEFYDWNRDAINKQAREDGHDGIVLEHDGQSLVVVFDPEQIREISNQALFRLKRATGTQGQESAIAKIQPPRPAEMTLGDRVRVMLSKVSKSWFSDNALAVEQGLFDSGASIKDWEKRLSGALQDASESAGKMYDLARNPAAVLAAVMRVGVPKLVDGAFQPVAGRKGLIDIFRPLYEKAGSGGNLVHLWEGYAAARRSSRLIKEQNRDGTSKEKRLTQQDIDELLALEQTYPIFRQVFDDWQTFNGQMLDFAVENGVLSAQMRKMWEANDYVPFYRVIEDLTDQAAGNSSSARLSGRQVRSKRLTGADAAIEPIFESIVKNSAYVLDSVYKNEAMKRTVKMLSGHALVRAPMSFQPVRFNAQQIEKALSNAGIVMLSERDLAASKPAGQMARAATSYRSQLRQLSQQELEQWNTMFSMVAPAGSNVVSVMIDGKAQYYYVDDPLLLRSIQAIGPQSMSNLMRFMSGGKELLTNLVTTDPGFMAVNFLRDTISAWVTSNAPFKPVIDGLKGAMDSWKDDPLRWKLQTAGASLGGFYDTRGADAYAAMELDAGAAPALGVRANWRRWQRFGAHFENANRMAIARAIIDSGGSVAEAAYQAQDVMNFSMHGDSKSIRALTMTVPFMNARLQGLYRLWRGRNTGSFLQRGAIVAAATLALLASNWDDERYWELEEFDRDMNWHFWIGEQHFKIAKPFEVGQIFGTIWERTAATAFGPDTARLLVQRMGAMIKDTFAMNPVPQVFKPIIEQYANKNSFTGRPIENMSLQGLLPEQRYMPWTSETARVFSAALPDWAPTWLRSPVRVEALVRGYLGTIGLYALQMSDQVSRPLGGFGEPPALGLKDLPVVRRFYSGDTATRTKYEEPIYKLLDIANETRKSVMELRRRGDAEGAARLAADNAEIIAARGRLNAFSTQMRALNMQERAVWNSSSDPSEKKAKIDALRSRRNDLLRQSADLIEQLDPYLPYL